MRINRYLAQHGLGSRRSVEKLILDGRISINGIIIQNLGQRVSETDQVLLDGRAFSTDMAQDEAKTWIYHKPVGLLCTRDDPRGRPTIWQDLSHLPPPYQAVGRLDCQSRGLLIISRDGDLTHLLLHPSQQRPRQYQVVAQGPWQASFIEQLSRGVNMVEGGLGHAKVLAVRALPDHKHELFLELHQGKKREIRYSLRALGLRVIDLKRIRFGALELGDLPEGSSRALSHQDLELLLKNSSDSTESGRAYTPFSP